MLNATVFPIALYRPVRVPLTIDGAVPSVVHVGVYVVHAKASEAEGPVAPVGPTESRVIFTVEPALSVIFPAAASSKKLIVSFAAHV